MSPDIRKHRGPHPEDATLFANERLSTLRTAVSELSWLLTRDYDVRLVLGDDDTPVIEEFKSLLLARL